MNYFSIRTTNNKNIIGHYPQTELYKDFDPGNRSVYNVQTHEFPNFIPDFRLKIHNKAKPTNILKQMITSNCLVVDMKFKDILSDHKLPKHRFYPMKVYWDEIELEYFWFHYIVDDFWDYIDKEKSYGEVLDIGEDFKLKRKIKIRSEQQVIDETSGYVKNELNKAGKIYMKKDFPKYDLYQNRLIDYNTIISESLKNRLEEEGMTGLEIKAYPKFVVP